MVVKHAPQSPCKLCQSSSSFSVLAVKGFEILDANARRLDACSDLVLISPNTSSVRTRRVLTGSMSRNDPVDRIFLNFYTFCAWKYYPGKFTMSVSQAFLRNHISPRIRTEKLAVEQYI